MAVDLASTFSPSFTRGTVLGTPGMGLSPFTLLDGLSVDDFLRMHHGHSNDSVMPYQHVAPQQQQQQRPVDATAMLEMDKDFLLHFSGGKPAPPQQSGMDNCSSHFPVVMNSMLEISPCNGFPALPTPMAAPQTRRKGGPSQQRSTVSKPPPGTKNSGVAKRSSSTKTATKPAKPATSVIAPFSVVRSIGQVTALSALNARIMECERWSLQRSQPGRQ